MDKDLQERLSHLASEPSIQKSIEMETFISWLKDNADQFETFKRFVAFSESEGVMGTDSDLETLRLAIKEKGRDLLRDPNILLVAVPDTAPHWLTSKLK